MTRCQFCGLLPDACGCPVRVGDDHENPRPDVEFSSFETWNDRRDPMFDRRDVPAPRVSSTAEVELMFRRRGERRRK